MPKNPHVRTLMDSDQVKASERQLKSARRNFCQILWSLWKKISSNNSALVVSKILKLDVNILTPYDKYSVAGKASAYRNQFKCSYLKIRKYLPHFSRISKIYLKIGIL